MQHRTAYADICTCTIVCLHLCLQNCIVFTLRIFCVFVYPLKKPFLFLVLLGILCTANKEPHCRGKLVSFLFLRQTLWHLNLLSIVKMALKTVKKLRPIHYSLTSNIGFKRLYMASCCSSPRPGLKQLSALLNIWGRQRTEASGAKPVACACVWVENLNPYQVDPWEDLQQRYQVVSIPQVFIQVCDVLPHLEIKEGRQEEPVSSQTPVIPLLTSVRAALAHSWRGRWRGRWQRLPRRRGGGTSCVCGQDAACYNEGVVIWRQAPVSRQRDSVAGSVSVLPWVWKLGDMMGWMNRLWQFGGDKSLTQLRWSKVKGNGNEQAAFGEMLMFILPPRGQMFILI